MGRIVFVTSFKGGVGKTTVSANIASALTMLGKSVLVADADFQGRCMDLVLGLENMSVYDCMDVLEGRVRVENAIIRLENNKRLSFLPAPASFPAEADSAFSALMAERVAAVFSGIRPYYDYIILDSSAEDSPLYRAFAAVADDALVVTFHQSTAIRAAERTAITLTKIGHTNIRLIVNCFYGKTARDALMPDLLEIVHRSRIRLLGVIPYDNHIVSNQERGETAFDNVRSGRRLKVFEAAFLNTAKRLCGIRVPLLKDVYRPKRLKKYLNAPATDKKQV